MCKSNKLPGDADASGPGISLGGPFSPTEYLGLCRGSKTPDLVSLTGDQRTRKVQPTRNYQSFNNEISSGLPFTNATGFLLQ